MTSAATGASGAAPGRPPAAPPRAAAAAASRAAGESYCDREFSRLLVLSPLLTLINMPLTRHLLSSFGLPRVPSQGAAQNGFECWDFIAISAFCGPQSPGFRSALAEAFVGECGILYCVLWLKKYWVRHAWWL